MIALSQNKSTRCRRRSNMQTSPPLARERGIKTIIAAFIIIAFATIGLHAPDKADDEIEASANALHAINEIKIIGAKIKHPALEYRLNLAAKQCNCRIPPNTPCRLTSRKTSPAPQTVHDFFCFKNRNASSAASRDCLRSTTGFG